MPCSDAADPHRGPRSNANRSSAPTRRKPVCFCPQPVLDHSEQQSGGRDGGRAALAWKLAGPLICQRADYQDAYAVGQGVTEYAPKGKAAEEMRALWASVDELAHKIFGHPETRPGGRKSA